jgi:hypothetical protein
MDGYRKYFGFLLAAPITLVGLLYVAVFYKLGWYRWHGIRNNALIWVVSDTAPAWLLKIWRPWAGHTVGNVVVMQHMKEMHLLHELKHVDQCMRIGLLQPIAYGLMYLAIKWGCPGSDAYYDCSFEIDARRAAGQLIDITGTIDKLHKRS